MKKLIVGNWKMNLGREDAKTLAKALAKHNKTASDKFEMVICPPSIWLTDIVDAVQGSAVAVGSQDVHEKEKGAFTGNLSAGMLKDAGLKYAIVGHSERRQFHNEANSLIKSKAEAAIAAGLTPIICVGEVETERNANAQETVVGQQLAESLPTTGKYVIAYEPVWAIGTGKTATPEDVRAMHEFIRSELSKSVDQAEQVAILYGGSVKASNAAEILATDNVDGVLVGGASLDANEFWAIAQAA
jgi:triosephosphate isomerase